MLNHVTSEHGNSPECSENSGSDSCGENELELEDEKTSLTKKPRTVPSTVSRYGMHGKTSELNCRDMLDTTRNWSCNSATGTLSYLVIQHLEYYNDKKIVQFLRVLYGVLKIDTTE
jgi:hypothetical protein